MGQETFKLRKARASEMTCVWEAGSSISTYREKHELVLFHLKRLKKKLDYLCMYQTYQIFQKSTFYQSCIALWECMDSEGETLPDFFFFFLLCYLISFLFINPLRKTLPNFINFAESLCYLVHGVRKIWQYMDNMKWKTITEQHCIIVNSTYNY